MPNLLDMFGVVPKAYGGLLDEEELRRLKSQSQQNALMTAASALLQAGAPSKTPTNTGLALLQGLNAGRQGFESSLTGGLQNAVTIQKLQEAQQAKAREKQVADLLPQLIGQQPIGIQEVTTGGTQMPTGLTQFNSPEAQMSVPVMGQVPVDQALQKLLAIGGPEAFKGIDAYRALRDVGKPEYMTAGDVVLQRNPEGGLSVAYQAEEKPEKTPDWMAQYLYAQKDPKFADFLNQKQASSRQNINVNLAGDKALSGGLGKGISDQLVVSRDQAVVATDTLRTTNNIKPLLDDVYSGPFSSAQTLIARVGEKMGTTGKTTQETLTNTTSAVQGLAKLEIDTAAAMKGQGQITENERALIRRAAGGDLATMTAYEVKTLVGALEKTAQYKIRQNADLVRRASKLKGGEELAPFYDVPMPTFTKGRW